MSPSRKDGGVRHAAWLVRSALVVLASAAQLAAASAAAAQLPAFPGAEGFGATSLGGRGGRVVKVTNLNASGPGSLQEAAAAEGARTVVFAVAGVIRGDVAIKHSRITIAGQTAPAPGITIEGRLLVRPEPWSRLHDIVVRFLRVRPPPSSGHEGDAIQFPDTERVMLDHLSLAWANDETVDVIHASDLTLQWSTLEESDVEGHAKGGAHNFGILSAYPGSGNVSILHNLFAHHSRRSPSLSPYVPGKPGDFRNNVVYDFQEGLGHDGHVPRASINLVGNYYKRGPSSPRITPFAFHPEGRYFLAGNVVEGVGSIDDVSGKAGRAPEWLVIDRTGQRLDQPAAVPTTTTRSAYEAYREVLRRAGGLPRDRVTLRTIEQVIAGTGSWGRHAPATLGDGWYLAGIERGVAPADTDGDGMPDAWEDANGLDKRDGRDHGQTLPSGYTAIEAYLDARASQLVNAQLEGRGETVVILGASYARGWPVHELAGRRVVNKGVSGEQSGGMLARFEQDVIAAKPGSVILWGFINDIHRAPPGELAATLARTRSNVVEMVRRARAHGIRPILATEVTIRPPAGLANTVAGWIAWLRNKRSYAEVVNEHVLATNRWIRDYAREQGLAVLDFQPVLSDADGMRAKPYAAKDGSHLSPAAYAKLTEQAEATLAALLDR